MRRTKTRWLLALAALAALALSGCGGGPGPVDEDGSPVQPPPASAPALALGFTEQAPEGAYLAVDAFELAGTSQIRVVADWKHVTVDEAQRLELRRPGGIVYYATTIPFSGAIGSDRSVTALPDGTLRVVYVLEVAGTPIESYAMTGAWQVTAALDGTDTSATASFQLF